MPTKLFDLLLKFNVFKKLQVSIILFASLSLFPNSVSAAKPILNGQLVIQNPKAEYLSFEKIEFTSGGCSPSGATSLELRSDNPQTGNVISAYAAPKVNAAGYVRAAVMLPINIQRGTYYLAFNCVAPNSAQLTSSAAIKVETAVVTAPEPQVPIAPGVVTLTPTEPVVVDAEIAKTGLNTIIVLPVLAAIALIGMINIMLSRRRQVVTTWSATGNRFNNQR
jgi:hypothetical protein